jgi:hypothetical protein
LKYTEEKAKRTKTGDVNWKNFYFNRGREKNEFRKMSVAVNTEIYIKECLQPRLFPFIYKHHSNFNFQFVHDLAGGSLFYRDNRIDEG